MKKWIIKIAAGGVFLGVVILPNLNIPGAESNQASVDLKISEAHHSQADDKKILVLDQKYNAVIEKLQADLIQEMNQVNISKEDILRGWYYGSEKKYGTPDTWVFQKAGQDSRWISHDFIEE